jgi:CHAD domain-containing protein
MNESSRAYILPAPVELASLLSGLPEKYHIRERAIAVDTICYLDTYDWRLCNKEFLCLRVGKRSFVLTNFTGEFRLQEDFPAQETPLHPHFSGATQLGEKLVSLAGVRALLPLAEISRKSQFFQIINRDQKIVLTGSLEFNHLMAPTEEEGGQPTFLGGSLRLFGVRSYDRILEQVMEGLQAQGLEPGYSEERTLRLALGTSGEKALHYSSQFSIALDPAQTVIHAAQRIFLHLLTGMEQNVFGIIDDIDTEFLHDYRVALRRTRSLLGSLKKIVPSDDVVRFQMGLKEIGTFTGPVRDLDVYLLARKDYQTMLPDGLQEGLALFFQGLTRQRRKELLRLRKALQSRKYHSFMAQWKEYLENSILTSSLAAGQRPCRQVARKAIRKRLRSILESGAQIGPQSPDTELHSLRIQAKKLRYLLEFYRSLFPESEMDVLVKSLKKLQDNLGNFNDLSVQQKMLGEYQNTLAVKDLNNALKVAAALGGLITHLHEEQTDVRNTFEQTFEQFTIVVNGKLFTLLFQ